MCDAKLCKMAHKTMSTTHAMQMLAKQIFNRRFFFILLMAMRTKRLATHFLAAALSKLSDLLAS